MPSSLSTSKSSVRPTRTPRATERSRRLARLEIERRMYGTDLAAFVRAAWLVLEPSSPIMWNWHHDLICEYLTAVTQGRIRNLIINIPPQHTKSRLVTVLWPCWAWTALPDLNWIFSSYSGGPTGLSTKHSIERRGVLESEWYQERWGDAVELAVDQNIKTLYKNERGGQMLATSTGGTVTGFAADVIVIDDPVNPSEARSEAEAKTDERIVFPLSHRVVERQRGDPIDAHRFPKSVLAGLKSIMGSWGYAGQFQQEPSPEGGAIFLQAWFQKRWRELPAHFDEIVQSWDCAFKDTKDSDYVAGGLWGRIGASFLLIDQVREHLSFTGTVARIKEPIGPYAPLWKRADAKLIEDKANGPAVVNTLQADVVGVIAVTPEGGKVSRAQAVAPLAEAGNVILPAAAPWLAEYLGELVAFPAAAHDDQVDQTTQALHYMKIRGASAATWTEYMQTHDARGKLLTPAEPQPPVVTEDLT